MTVKDVLKTTALVLGREDVCNYLENPSTDVGEDTLSTINVLVRLLNLVVSELSGTYIPLAKTEDITPIDNKIYFSELSENALKIKKVLSPLGKEIAFSFYPEYIVVNSGSTVSVQYEYLPANLDLEDKVGYSESQVPKRVLAYGTAAEFSITEGSFSKAVMWHERYVEEIKSICFSGNSQIKQRSWV